MTSCRKDSSVLLLALIQEVQRQQCIAHISLFSDNGWKHTDIDRKDRKSTEAISQYIGANTVLSSGDCYVIGHLPNHAQSLA